MTLTEDLTRRAAELVGQRTSRRGFLGRTALVGSALTVAPVPPTCCDPAPRTPRSRGDVRIHQ
jgi:hypothetical protein